jgi:low affinity Fe/Cu permease
MNEAFRKAAHRVSGWVGSPLAFAIAFLVVLTWAVTGPAFGFSDTWQLVINTGTTIVTFLMVFLIQNTQNRDSRAIHLKLDDLILHLKGPDNSIVDTDNLTDEDIQRLEQRFNALARRLGKRVVAAEAANGGSAADEPKRVPSKGAAPKAAPPKTAARARTRRPSG